MNSTPQLVIDSRQLNAWLIRHASSVLEDTACEIAERARRDVPPEVSVATTGAIGRNGRPYSMVTITHPSGLARQAKHGVLTKAAAAAGLDIHRYPTH